MMNEDTCPVIQVIIVYVQGHWHARVFEQGMLTDEFVHENKQELVQTVLRNIPRARYSLNAAVESYTSGQVGEWPDVDKAVKEILAEIQLEMTRGQLKPFVEGEPIGQIPEKHRADLRRENGRGGKLPRNW